MKHASKRIMVFAIACSVCAIGFGATAVYAAYSGNNTARHEASASITNDQCIACHGETVLAGSLDPAVATAHQLHLASPLLRFDTMSDGCAVCHESTDIEQGSGATVNKQVNAEVCANCHGAFPAAAHESCGGVRCHQSRCDDCHVPGWMYDPTPKHAAIPYIDAEAASDPASCPKCHGGLDLYQVVDRVPIDIITASVGAHGSISPSGVRAVDAGDDASYAITPASGYHVQEVRVNGVPVGAVTSYTFHGVHGDQTISAFFAANTYTITASAGANGSISPLGVSTLDYGSDSANYVITPSAGHVVANVVVDGASVGAVTSYTFRDVNDDHTISVTFAVSTYTITASAGANGSISPLGVSALDYGSDSETYVITPQVGYAVADVVVDGVSAGAVTTYRFTNVHGDHTISVTFRSAAIVKRATTLTIKSDRTTSYRGHRIAFSGKISPSSMAAGASVTVWMRKAGRSWAKLGTVHTTSSDNWSYSLRTSTRSHGTYYVRVRYAGSSAYTSCASPYKKIYIR